MSGAGYTFCTCGTCFDLTISGDMSEPELCSECEDEGCTPGGECCRDTDWEYANGPYHDSEAP